MEKKKGEEIGIGKKRNPNPLLSSAREAQWPNTLFLFPPPARPSPAPTAQHHCARHPAPQQLPLRLSRIRARAADQWTPLVGATLPQTARASPQSADRTPPVRPLLLRCALASSPLTPRPSSPTHGTAQHQHHPDPALCQRPLARCRPHSVQHSRSPRCARPFSRFGPHAMLSLAARVAPSPSLTTLAHRPVSSPSSARAATTGRDRRDFHPEPGHRDPWACPS